MIIIVKSGEWKIYVNNVLLNTSQNVGSPIEISLLNRSSNFIGKSNWSGDAIFNGYIKFVRIYNSELT